ncbi:MAG: hypothetical protein WCF36_16170 [Candidatus Nanopelagicales bacterium]
MARKSLVALITVGILALAFAVSLISAVQLLAPRDMPFGVTGTSPVVAAVQQEYSLDLQTYANEADLTAAAERGDIYGGYVVGSTTDTLVTVPAKSFFGEVYLRAGFADAAKQADRTFTNTVVAPLPIADRTGAVVGLLLLPTLVGGYMIASLLCSASQKAAAPGRIAIVLAFAVAVALITGLAAGPILGAIPTGNLLPLGLALFLVTAVVGLSAVAIQALVGRLGSLVVALLFIVIGGAGAGGGGVALLPNYWQTIGALFPPRHAVELYRNVLYFDGNNIGWPIAVLLGYGLVSLAIIVAKTRRAAVATPAGNPAEPAAPGRRRIVPKDLVAPVGFSLILTTLFAFNYMSSGHEPVARDMPFAVVGSPSLAQAAQGDLLSLDIIEYDTNDAATQAMDRAEVYGALITSDSGTELMVVPSMSDIAPLDLAANFEQAAAAAGDTISVKAYTPTPLAPKDPFALVVATLLVALLIGGYMSAALLATAVGSASGHWRGVWLAGFAVGTGLVLDLATTFWLQGIPTDSFWVAWPIMSLIILVVALFAAVLRRALGPAGIIVTLIVILQFGNPSSGGSNGAAYLTAFWDEVGPFLPPRNAFLLLRNTLYFDGNNIAEPLAILVAYAVIGAAILAFLNWFRSPELVVPGLDDSDTTQAAGVAIPVGPIA